MTPHLPVVSVSFVRDFLTNGVVVNPVDLMIASVALTYDLVLVTHNVRHFEVIPDLRIEDWLAP